MRHYRALLVALILLTTILQLPLAIADPEWLTGWDKRVKITIDSDDINANLNDFPVLVYLSTSSGINGDNVSFVFDEVGANSLKIAVTEDDETTECYVEVEKWDNGAEEAWLWVKVPAIASRSDTDIYLYFDNDHADNVDYVGPPNSVAAENVWDTHFKLVDHMQDDPDNASTRDSTENDNDGTKTGAAQPTEQEGKIADAQDYDGNEEITYVDDEALDFGTNDFTVDLWIAVPATGSAMALVNKKDEANFDNEGWTVQINPDSKLQGRIADGDSNSLSAADGTALDDGSYYHVAIAFDRSGNMILYVNGIADGTAKGIANEAGSINNFEDVLSGVRTHGTPLYYTGDIDDLRLSETLRPPAWIKATYETGRDDLIDFGSEEILVLERPTDLFGAGFNSSSPYVSLYWKSNLTDISLFEVQNSTDKISWETLGSNTTAEYHDFQVVNGTERYYQVRACNFTGGVWDNSTFTDINFETVYFVEAAEAAEGDTIIMGGSGIFWIILIIIVPIVAYIVNKK